ncbi:hypothetical protein OGATHE_003997 [Ogataea polymorpha]|uniref:Uncharacterized protein n=1 Tax=Ogataea polymorpha TaxID=460523 RepID=A0A9P8P4M4_9ASCO|nr:hypothetical protein OGATHE_003997 [Ogataea polymorpha]
MSWKCCHTDDSVLKFSMSNTIRSPSRTMARSLIAGDRNFDTILSSSSLPVVPDAASRYARIWGEPLESSTLNTSDDDCSTSSSSHLRIRLQMDGKTATKTSSGSTASEPWPASFGPAGPFRNTASTWSARSNSGEYSPLESPTTFSSGGSAL